jgi:hypothetical protein
MPDQNKLINPNDFIYTEKSETYSTWRNDNDRTAVFKLLTDKKITKNSSRRMNNGEPVQGSIFLNVKIEPGESKQLPSEYDQAIRTVSPKTGQVVGGLCPWLVKVGEEDIVVHVSLDYKTSIMETEALELAKSMKKETELRAALAELERRKLSLQIEKEVVAEKKSAGRPSKKE